MNSCFYPCAKGGNVFLMLELSCSSLGNNEQNQARTVLCSYWLRNTEFLLFYLNSTSTGPS